MIIIMGLAGAGKGTQGHLLADERGCPLVSTGEIFRAAMAEGKYQEMLEGKLISDQETITVVDDALSRIDVSKGFILDGFPRNVVQTEWLVEQIKKGRFTKPIVLNLVVSKEVTRERLKLRHRPDDTDQAINQRFNDYERAVTPIMDTFRGAHVPVCNVDAAQSVDDVHASILKCIADFKAV